MLNRKFLFMVVVIGLSFSLVTYSFAQSYDIPSWIKDLAGFWSEDKISDREFLSALQYLIDKGMLNVSSEETKSTVVIPEDTKILNTEELETRKDFSDLDLLTFKVTQLQELVSHPEIIQAVIDSNAEFGEMSDPNQYILEEDKAWKKQPKNKESPFMGVLMSNHPAKILQTKSIISTEEFGDVFFPEIIVTNAYGANVAITIRTDDYNQGDEIWWIKAKKHDVQFRDVMWDESAKIYSSDIIVRIVDDNGHFIGVLNAATPVK